MAVFTFTFLPFLKAMMKASLNFAVNDRLERNPLL